MSTESNISVVQQADKGAIIIVRPELLKSEVLEKFQSPSIHYRVGGGYKLLYTVVWGWHTFADHDIFMKF